MSLALGQDVHRALADDCRVALLFVVAQREIVRALQAMAERSRVAADAPVTEGDVV